MIRFSIGIAAALTLILVLPSAHGESEPVKNETASPVMLIDTVAGNGDPSVVGQPFGVEIGPDGALYITEVQNHRIRKLDLKTRRLTTVVGTGKKGYSGDGGPATKAELNEPYEVRFDAAGNMYFVEMQNHLIRRVDAKTRIITTIAGTGTAGFGGDGGPAIKAKFNRPHSIALDGQGFLYVADIRNHRIRRIDLKTNVITTIAGNGKRAMPKEGALAKGKPMVGPRALYITARTLWIALREGHSVWAMDLDSGKLKHIAGSGKKGYKDGSAGESMFNGPKGIVMGPKGFIYVVDTENQVIRKIDPKSGHVSTVAGAGPKARGYGGDGGDARKAKMDRPHGIGVDRDGVLYIGDTNTHRVRRVRAR